MRPTWLTLFSIISVILFKDVASVKIVSAEGKGAMKSTKLILENYS